MRNQITACAAFVVALGFAGAAAAEQWVDYSPEKGFTSVTYIHVEPSRIDDYLVALKKTWVPSEEMSKRHGLIDGYGVAVNLNASTTGANVVLTEHYVSYAAFAPDKARDMAMQKEAEAMMPKAEAAAVQVERAKYRTQIRQEMWGAVDFSK